jgi:hypothetical protein
MKVILRRLTKEFVTKNRTLACTCHGWDQAKPHRLA